MEHFIAKLLTTVYTIIGIVFFRYKSAQFARTPWLARSTSAGKAYIFFFFFSESAILSLFANHVFVE